MNLEKLKYPIGQFEEPTTISKTLIQEWIGIIEYFPSELSKETAQLTESQLDTPYREGGWTLRQVVHHCADSHMNSFIRLKLALTEETPTVKPYFEDRWAELSDTKLMPIQASLHLLEGIHQRWAFLLKSMSTADFVRSFYHPEQQKNIRIDGYLGFYAWHCKHHLAHITETKKRLQWS
jgi:hypothetical protein